MNTELIEVRKDEKLNEESLKAFFSDLLNKLWSIFLVNELEIVSVFFLFLSFSI